MEAAAFVGYRALWRVFRKQRVKSHKRLQMGVRLRLSVAQLIPFRTSGGGRSQRRIPLSHNPIAGVQNSCKRIRLLDINRLPIQARFITVEPNRAESVVVAQFRRDMHGKFRHDRRTSGRTFRPHIQAERYHIQGQRIRRLGVRVHPRMDNAGRVQCNRARNAQRQEGDALSHGAVRMAEHLVVIEPHPLETAFQHQVELVVVMRRIGP